MAPIDKHPTVVAVRNSAPTGLATSLSVDELRQLALSCGADDAGVVSIERPELDDQRDDILGHVP